MIERHSTNQRPRQYASADGTLRRSGVRDLSDLTEIEADALPKPPPNPRGDIYLPQYAGRSYLPAQDYELQIGKPPEKIDRIHNARIYGLIGARQINGWYQQGEQFRVGHVPASHPNRPVSGNPSVATSDSTYIPSALIGQPLP